MDEWKIPIIREGIKREILEKDYCKPGDELLWIVNKWFNLFDNGLKNLKPKTDNNPSDLLVAKMPPEKKPYKRNVKKSYLEKWIKEGSFEVFTLDMFFKQYPKQKYNDRLENHIRSLINKNVISQFNKPSGAIRFKVNRKVKETDVR